jgi:hypothetical protein
VKLGNEKTTIKIEDLKEEMRRRISRLKIEMRK